MKNYHRYAVIGALAFFFCLFLLWPPAWGADGTLIPRYVLKVRGDTAFVVSEDLSDSLKAIWSGTSWKILGTGLAIEGDATLTTIGNSTMRIGEGLDDDSNKTLWFVNSTDSGGIRYNKTDNDMEWYDFDTDTWTDIGSGGGGGLDSAEIMTVIRDTTYVDSALVGQIINDTIGAPGLTEIQDSILIPLGWLGVVSVADSLLVTKKYVDDVGAGFWMFGDSTKFYLPNDSTGDSMMIIKQEPGETPSNIRWSTGNDDVLGELIISVGDINATGAYLWLDGGDKQIYFDSLSGISVTFGGGRLDDPFGAGLVSSGAPNFDLDVQLLKDLVTTAPLTGGTDDILVGADADITIGISNIDSASVKDSSLSMDDINWEGGIDLTTGRVTGVLPAANGGTGPSMANGELLIGDGTGVPTIATLTAGNNLLDITNGSGSISLEADTGTQSGALGLASKSFVRDSGSGGSARWVDATTADTVNLLGVTDSLLRIIDSGTATAILPIDNTSLIVGGAGLTEIGDSLLVPFGYIGVVSVEDSLLVTKKYVDDLSGDPVYAELYVGEADWDTTTVTTGGTYYRMGTVYTGMTAGDTSGIAVDTANGAVMIIQTAGKYFVTLNASFAGLDVSNDDTLKCAIFLNTVKQDDLEFHRIVTSTALGAAGISGVISLAADDSIEVKWTSDDDADDIEIHTCNFTAQLIQNAVGTGGIDSTTITDASVSMSKDMATFTESELEAELSDVTALFTNNVTGDVTVAGGTSDIGNDKIATEHIEDQAISGDDVDSTLENFVFNDAYRITSAEADSAYVTANTVGDSVDLALRLADTAAYTTDIEGLISDSLKVNKEYKFTIFDLNSVYGIDTQVGIDLFTNAALTIDSFSVSLDADPATEVEYSLKFADAFIGFANATVIDDTATVAGVTNVRATIADPTVPADKVVYLEFDAEPIAAITQMLVKIWFHYD